MDKNIRTAIGWPKCRNVNTTEERHISGQTVNQETNGYASNVSQADADTDIWDVSMSSMSEYLFDD